MASDDDILLACTTSRPPLQVAAALILAPHLRLEVKPILLNLKGWRPWAKLNTEAGCGAHLGRQRSVLASELPEPRVLASARPRVAIEGVCRIST
jgi:hypothetical protein